MLIDSSGQAITQRKFPKLAAIKVVFGPTGFVLIPPAESALKPIVLPDFPDCEAAVDVHLWDSRFEAFAQPEKYSRWFQRYLETDCLLVGLPDRSMRRREFSEGKIGELACHDSTCLSIVSEESLEDLNRRAPSRIEDFCSRFRSSIVVEDTLPYAEDGWKKIRIRGTVLIIRKKIPRCMMIEIDQRTGALAESGLLAALAKYRKAEKDAMLGVYAYPVGEACGKIAVGDKVEILE